MVIREITQVRIMLRMDHSTSELVLGYTFEGINAEGHDLEPCHAGREYIDDHRLFGSGSEFTNANVSEGNGSDLRRGMDMGGWPTTMRFLFVNFCILMMSFVVNRKRLYYEI